MGNTTSKGSCFIAILVYRSVLVTLKRWKQSSLDSIITVDVVIRRQTSACSMCTPWQSKIFQSVVLEPHTDPERGKCRSIRDFLGKYTVVRWIRLCQVSAEGKNHTNNKLIKVQKPDDIPVSLDWLVHRDPYVNQNP